MKRVATAFTAILTGLAMVSCEDFGSGGGESDPSSVPREFSVSANDQNGGRFTAPAAGTYRFTYVRDAYSFTDPAVNWHTQLRVYVNKPLEWGAADDPETVNFTAVLGDFQSLPSKADAEAAGAGANLTVTLGQGGYATFIVSGRRGWFIDNVGSVRVFVGQV